MHIDIFAVPILHDVFVFYDACVEYVSRVSLDGFAKIVKRPYLAKKYFRDDTKCIFLRLESIYEDIYTIDPITEKAVTGITKPS